MLRETRTARAIPAPMSKLFSCMYPKFDMKINFLAAILVLILCSVAGLAQTVENASHSTLGYITSGGTIENASHSTIGYITGSGAVENSSRSTIGYITSNGTVENASHSTIGYISDSGTVENASHSTIGYVNS